MFRRAAFVLLILGAFWAGMRECSAGAEPQGQKQEKEKVPPPAKEATASMTGCVDEQEGIYVLLNDRTMSPIARLEADGFPKEGFAKHLGHKVTVRGTSSSQGAVPVFKVRTVETVSETCSPQ